MSLRHSIIGDMLFLKVEIIKGQWIYEGHINHQGIYVVKPAKKKRLEKGS